MHRHHQTVVGTVLATACLWGLIQPAGAAVEYTITDLGSVARIYKLNEQGQTVGYVNAGGATPAWRGFLWSNGQLSTLSTLVGHSFARGLNDRGQVVGTAYAGPGYATPRAVVWDNGTIRGLNATGGPTLTIGRDINDAGEILAESSTTAYILQDGVPHELGIEHAYIINEKGLVAGTKNTGQSDGNGPIAHAALWDDGQVRDLGTLGGKRSIPWDMNDHGVVVGEADVASSPYGTASYWDGTGIHQIPTNGVDATAYGINNLGEVVGCSNSLSDQFSQAFLYSDGTVKDLNNLIDPVSGWVLTSAVDINDRGQIIGEGTFQGTGRAFLLTPVPSPATIVMLLPGILWIRRHISC